MSSTSTALLSPLWYRVAGLRPRLRAGVQVQRQWHRDQLWYQLADAGTGRRHRINAAAYHFIGLLDGTRSTGEAWDVLTTQDGDNVLAQDEAIRLLGQLNTAGLLQCQLTPDIERLFRQYRQQVTRRRWLELNPLAVRVRAFNPARLLSAFEPWLKLLFQPLTFALWLAVMAPALLLAAHHWPTLSAFATTHLDSPRYLVIAWFAYPVIKALHELGHALAVRRWGGEVKEAGFTLFVLVPAPYVDASAASGFTSRWQRAVVSGVGIMVELFIAALALFVWINVQAGWVQDCAFVVMLIASVSTVLFNGNPLLRFDGYYVLCDALDLPNLDTRSQAWWSALIQRRVFAIPAPDQPLARGEFKWLLLYAPLALAYRIYISMLIALWLSVKSVLLGVAAAIAALVMLLLMPLNALVRNMMNHVQGDQRSRTRRRLWLAGAAALLLIAVVPVPYGTVSEAVVWLPEQAEVRAQTDGFVQNIQVRDGDQVKPGQILATLDDPVLLAKQAEAHNRQQGLRVQYFNTLQSTQTGDRSQARHFAEALAHAETEVAHTGARIEQLDLRSETGGRMVMTRQDDMPGTFLKRGQALGYVFAPGVAIVRAVVADEDAALVRSRTRSASVWLEERPGTRLAATVQRDVPAASFKLPSAALADRNGGSIPTDPADNDNLRTLQPIFTVDVTLPQNALERIGGRAWVRFDFGPEPLAFQWARAAGQLLLKHFEKAT